jgi:hypothetical protein
MARKLILLQQTLIGPVRKSVKLQLATLIAEKNSLFAEDCMDSNQIFFRELAVCTCQVIRKARLFRAGLENL